MNQASLSRTGFAVLAVCFVLNMFGRGLGDMYTVFLLPIERDLGWSRSQLTSVYSVYLLVNGCIAPFVGLVFDRLGARWVYAAGLTFLGCAYLLASSMQSLWQFYLFIGAMIGVGVSFTGMVPASGMLSKWFKKRLSRVLGVAFSAGGLGVVVFVPLAQWLIDSDGWRVAYRYYGYGLLALVPVVILALPWKRFAAGHPAARGGDRPGGANEGWTVRTAMGTRIYWGLAQAFFLTAAGMFSVIVQLVVILIDAGITPLAAATAFGVTGMLSTVSVMGSGFVAERFGYLKTVTGSYVGTAIGMALLAVISVWPSTVLLVLFVISFGFCLGVRGPIISAICTRSFPGPRVATIYGTIYSMNALGAAFGSLVGGVLHDLTGSYMAGFGFALVCLAIASSAFWTVPGLRNFR
ncbi:MAG: MFS transporter [Burkholderiales bacterium]